MQALNFISFPPNSFCRGENISTCPTQESNPGGWIYRQTLYHVTEKVCFYCKAVAVERTYFNLPQPGIEPRWLDLQANILPSHWKSQLLPQGSRSVLYIPRPCDILINSIKYKHSCNYVFKDCSQRLGLFVF